MAEISEFEHRTFTFAGTTRDVYEAGSGPAVIVIAEIPGIHASVLEFAATVRDAGFTVVLPRLFGSVPSALDASTMLKVFPPLCVSREFAALARNRTEPVSVWLRALARDAHERHGGPGVGVVGMCFTGGFALGMMVDDVVVAPVLSQPSVPFPLSSKHKADIHLSPEDLARVKERVEDGVCVLGLRFTKDALSPPERFETLRRELGDNFIGVEIDSSPGNEWGIKSKAHSVLTLDLVADDPEHPTAKALAQVLEFFRDRLAASPEPAGDVTGGE